MRIFVLGAGGTGSLLAHLLKRQGHTVWCGDRDPERGRRFLGKKSGIEVVETNARNLWAIVRSARGANLIVNASPPVYNEIILRAALRLRAHYLDLNAHLTRSLFKPEQYRFHKRFVAKNRAALICTGVAPGLTNLLAKRGSELLDSVDSIHIRLLESTESKDPVSTWSPEAAYDEAISRPRVYRDGRFALARRFDGREKFRFPLPSVKFPFTWRRRMKFASCRTRFPCARWTQRLAETISSACGDGSARGVSTNRKEWRERDFRPR